MLQNESVFRLLEKFTFLLLGSFYIQKTNLYNIGGRNLFDVIVWPLTFQNQVF